MTASPRNLVDRALDIGSDPADPSDLRFRKRLLVGIALLILPAGFLWGLAYWLALTAPPRRQAVNSLLALVAVVVGLLQPAAALAVLAFVWAVRKAAMDREALPGRADSGSTAPRAAVPAPHLGQIGCDNKKQAP